MSQLVATSWQRIAVSGDFAAHMSYRSSGHYSVVSMDPQPSLSQPRLASWAATGRWQA